MEILSYKNVIYGKDRVRRNYSRVQTNVELPNLIEIQTKSYDDFINNGLKRLFATVSPNPSMLEKGEYILVSSFYHII